MSMIVESRNGAIILTTKETSTSESSRAPSVASFTSEIAYAFDYGIVIGTGWIHGMFQFDDGILMRSG